MDRERKRQLKALGKAAVERRSAELLAAMNTANPAPLGTDAWAKNYREGTLREKWVRKVLPILHKENLDKLFVVLPVSGSDMTPFVGLYVQCQRCGSAVPAAMPRKLFYWGSCACGNVKWRIIWLWRKAAVRDPSLLMPVKLIGKG